LSIFIFSVQQKLSHSMNLDRYCRHRSKARQVLAQRSQKSIHILLRAASPELTRTAARARAASTPMASRVWEGSG
jgi:hypothetical protein